MEPLSDGDPLPDDLGIDIEESVRFWNVVWPIVGYDIPPEIHRRILDADRILGERDTWSEETARRMRFAVSVHDGIAAAFYHRDRIEEIEREIVKAIRAEISVGREGQTSSTATPKLSFEYVAYLNASRRTLEYLSRAVSVCFDRNTDKIKKLGNVLLDAEPYELASRVSAICGSIYPRFPHLLNQAHGMSARDQAAHKRPVEPVYLFVMFWHGKLGIELHAGNVGPLEPYNTLDIERMTADEPRLSKSLDAELAGLVDFCVELLELAARAEADRVANEPSQRRSDR
jgi:hypothetical protein